MELIFNEISFQPYTDNEHTLKTRFLDLLHVFGIAKSEYGFSHLVFPSNIRDLNVTPTLTFYEWAYAITHQGDKNKILSAVKKPFTNEVLAEKSTELSKYYYKNDGVGITETYCSGLATSHVLGLLNASLSSSPIWDNNKIEFDQIINVDFKTEKVSVFNISKGEHFEEKEIKQFIEYLGDIKLIKTDIVPTAKAISLREDHGKDKLIAFAKKLVLFEYIVSVINSLPFNSRAINLIKEVYSDGKIELVLYWEDKGIGLIVQTTGRNFRETEEIAKLIKKEFDR